MGLQLSLGKCELILPAGASAYNLPDLFPTSLLVDPDTHQSRVATNGNFELLGAAVGSKEHCEAFLAAKAAKAKVLLDKLPSLKDPQVALRLLRLCGGHCKLVHSMRTTPPRLQSTSLSHFDNDVRSTFCSVTSLLPNNEQWSQACRGLKYAGLGLRSTLQHAPAAYLASVTASSPLCKTLDNSYEANLEDLTSEVAQALEQVNNALQHDKRFSPETAQTARQQKLSDALDAAGHESRLAGADFVDKATLISECERGARELWQAVPSRTLKLALEPAEFVEELRSRLCMAERETDRWCPLCDSVYDTRGHHARMCCAGGDRTLRHNGLRNFIYRFAAAAGLHPELERQGLLLPARATEADQSRRRPADVYLPTWTGGSPVALDFAVTAPQRQEILAASSQEALASATAYSSSKREHLGTEAACLAQGVLFQPMVVETTGAWSPEASKVLYQLATASAVKNGRTTDTVFQELLQGTAVCVRRANARAALKRAGDEAAMAGNRLHSARAVLAASAT